jgi:hypothetical protein
MPALLSLAASGRTGTTTLRLDPAELGRLDIRIARVPGGGTAVSLTATRPATLDLLVRDQAALHRALDQAGIPPEGRSVSFHLAASPDAPLASAPPPATANAAGHAQPPHPAPQPSAGADARGEAAGSSGAGVGGGQLGSQGGGSGGEGAAQDGPRQPGGGRPTRAWPTTAAGAAASFIAPGRTGIDITA